MSKQKTVSSHSVSGVFVFLLLGIFAVSSTMMVLMGVKVYRGTAARSGVHSAGRIVSSYLHSMVRSSDNSGAVRVETLDGIVISEDAEEDEAITVPGIRTIALRSVYDDEEYVTRIYVYEGRLLELMREASEPFEPESGEAVCDAEEMTATLENGLLTVRVLSGGEWSEVVCALRSAEPQGGVV